MSQYWIYILVLFALNANAYTTEDDNVVKGIVEDANKRGYEPMETYLAINSNVGLEVPEIVICHYLPKLDGCYTN